MPTVLISGILSILETSGPVKACNGIALPLPFRLPGRICKRDERPDNITLCTRGEEDLIFGAAVTLCRP